MKDEIQKLQIKIREHEEIINDILKNNLHLSMQGFNVLLRDIEDWRIELAKLQTEQSKLIKRIVNQIKLN